MNVVGSVFILEEFCENVTVVGTRNDNRVTNNVELQQ